MTNLTYDHIQHVAEAFARGVYRQHPGVPALPATVELAVYQQILQQDYPSLVSAVTDYTAQFDPEGGHGFEHLEWVSALAGWIANHECDWRVIAGQRKDQIMRSAVLAGFLHDIDRHLGRGVEHMQQGAVTAERLLTAAGVSLPLVGIVVAHHDEMAFDPGNDEDLAVIFAAVFDADHFRYGLEREDTFWRMKEKQGVPPSQVIHDYHYLLPYRTAWRTSYGKKVGPQLIDFALAIAQHVEKTCDVQ